MLTVAEATQERRNGYAVWRCTCGCGKEVLVSSRHLKNGWAQDCGCRPRPKQGCPPVSGSGEDTGSGIPGRNAAGRIMAECPGSAPKDWVGKRFGSLTVVAYDGRKGGKHYWRCLCDCGKETRACQSNLQSGHTKSCGCRVDPVSTRHFVEGTCLESIRSRKLFANNTSGVRGVYRNKRTGRWSAQITFQGRTRYLGSFEELEDAIRARAQGERIFREFLERHDVQDKETRERQSDPPQRERRQNLPPFPKCIHQGRKEAYNCQTVEKP